MLSYFGGSLLLSQSSERPETSPVERSDPSSDFGVSPPRGFISTIWVCETGGVLYAIDQGCIALACRGEKVLARIPRDAISQVTVPDVAAALLATTLITMEECSDCCSSIILIADGSFTGYRWSNNEVEVYTINSAAKV